VGEVPDHLDPGSFGSEQFGSELTAEGLRAKLVTGEGLAEGEALRLYLSLGSKKPLCERGVRSSIIQLHTVDTPKSIRDLMARFCFLT